MSGIWSALVHQLTRYLHNLKIRGGGQRDPQYFYHLSLFSSNSLKSLLNLCLAVTVGQHLSQVQEEIGQLNESQDQTKTVVNQLELDRQRLEAIVAKSELELQRLKHERELDRQRLEALMEKSELDRQRLEHERELDQQRLEATEAKLKMLMDKLSLV